MEEGERTDSHFLCWGCGEFGQHCHGNHTDIGFSQGWVDRFQGQDRIKFVSCGSSHNVVVTEKNEIFAWGNGNSGQLGCSVVGTKWEPTQIFLPSDDMRPPEVAGVTCGGRHTMIWLVNGHVYSFGNNFYAQLGYDFKVNNYKANQLQPRLLKFLMYRHVVQVAAGDKHTVFLFSDATVAAMGNNTHGQVGTGGREEAVVPVSVDISVAIKYIASGANHNIALTESGDVYVWGYSRGCGHRRHDVLTPQRVLEGHRVVQVAGGGSHSLALTANGNIYSWGGGMDGQLGHEKTGFLAHPRKLRDCHVSGKTVYIACGEAFSAAVTGDGRLYMWGKSSHTIVSDEKSTYKVYEPTCVNDVNSPVSAVYCGAWHAAAITGINDRVLVDEDSESEDEDETVSISSLNTVGGDSISKSDNSGEAELQWEPSDVEIPVAPVSTFDDSTVEMVPNTRLTLAEFYAPTPDPKSRGLATPPHVAFSSLSAPERLHESEGAKRLVIQVPLSNEEPDNSSNSQSTSSSQSVPSLESTEHRNVMPNPVPPLSTNHIDSDRSSYTHKPAFPRSRTMAAADNSNHTVQISKHIATKYAPPRENTKLILSKNVSFVNAHDLKTTGPVLTGNAGQGRVENGGVSSKDVLAVTVEKQKQHLTAVLKNSSQHEPPQSEEHDIRLHRSKTTFSPHSGSLARGNTRFFYRRKSSLNQLVTRNAQTRAQLLNPRSLQRMASVGSGLSGVSGKPDGQLPVDHPPRKPVFSSASSWRERKPAFVNGTGDHFVPNRQNADVKTVVENTKDSILRVSCLKKEMAVISKVPNPGSPVLENMPVPGSLGKRNQLIKSSSLSCIPSSVQHAGHYDSTSSNVSGAISRGPVPTRTQTGRDDLEGFGRVRTVEKLGVESVGLPKGVAEGVRTG